MAASLSFFGDYRAFCTKKLHFLLQQCFNDSVQFFDQNSRCETAPGTPPRGDPGSSFGEIVQMCDIRSDTWPNCLALARNGTIRCLSVRASDCDGLRQINGLFWATSSLTIADKVIAVSMAWPGVFYDGLIDGCGLISHRRASL
jgi:hypothetical protein